MDQENIEVVKAIDTVARNQVTIINTMLGRVKEGSFKQSLIKQKNGYSNYLMQSRKYLDMYGQFGKCNNIRDFLVSLKTGVKTLFNRDSDYFANLLIINSTKGIVDITKRVKSNSKSEEKIKTLANNLIKYEQQNIENCKYHL